jgi:hypothetical protein
VVFKHLGVSLIFPSASGGFLLGFLSDHEDGGDVFFRNIG